MMPLDHRSSLSLHKELVATAIEQQRRIHDLTFSVQVSPQSRLLLDPQQYPSLQSGALSNHACRSLQQSNNFDCNMNNILATVLLAKQEVMRAKRLSLFEHAFQHQLARESEEEKIKLEGTKLKSQNYISSTESRSLVPEVIECREALSKVAEGCSAVGESTVLKAGKKNSKWMTTFEELKKYKEIHGDCIVPRGYALNPRLASWVAEQR